MKLYYKAPFEKGKVEKYRNFSEEYKKVFQSFIIGGRYRLSYSHDCVDIGADGMGYVILDINDKYPKRIYDLHESKSVEVKDPTQLVRFLREHGFTEVKKREELSAGTDF